MAQYNSLNVRLSNSQLNKLNSATKNETKIVLRLSSNTIGDSYDKINFSHELLLTNGPVANLRKVFANYLSTDIKLSKPQMSMMIQSEGLLGRFLGPLLKTRLPLMKNVMKPLAQSVLIPLGLTAAASAEDAGMHKKILESGRCHFSSSALPHNPSSSASHNNNNTILIISNDEMEDIIKIVKSLEDSGLLLKGVSGTIQNEAKEQ